MLAPADGELDNGPRSETSATKRMCAVSREVRPIEELIRFVVAPTGEVVADLKRKLPGRGLWVTASRQAVAEAVRRHHFSRGVKRDLRVSPTLAADTGVLPMSSNLSPDFTGTIHEQVWRDTANTFGSGDLTWLITVTNNPHPPPFPGSINDIERLTASDFTGFQTDVGFRSGAAGVDPFTVDRVNPGVIGFNFGPGLLPGQDSTILEIQTNATSWTAWWTGEIAYSRNGKSALYSSTRMSPWLIRIFRWPAEIVR